MMMNPTLLAYQTHVNACLSRYIGEDAQDPLRCAMRYASLQGGKRLRPLLVYLSAAMYDLPRETVDPIALAIECIHCYSLVHDDLPSMDNDALRRGKPTCHKVFGEATAILAGDGLLTVAFEILTQDNCVPPHLIHLIAKAAGMQGMLKGQILDLAAEKCQLTLLELITLHQAKTGALITASVLAGAMASGRTTAQEESALHDFGQALGLAFQIQDDILDATGQSHTMGKSPHQDEINQKCTFVTQLGLPQAHQQAQLYYTKALDALSLFGEKSNTLRELSAFVIKRVM